MMEDSAVSDAHSLVPDLARLAALKAIFRPSAPTDDADLFQGRNRELERVVSGIQELGQHVVIYGERGVGKTSIAYVARSIFLDLDRGSSLVVRVQCAEGDDFEKVWKRFRVRLQSEIDLIGEEVAEHLHPVLYKVEELLDYADGPLDAETVSRAVALIASRVRLMVILDEFDRLGAWEKSVPFSDLIKSLADNFVPGTLLVVGVADDVAGLIQGHHPSHETCAKLECLE